MNRDRLESQIRFIVEVDKLKGILRQTYHISGERRENDAEHSWHLAVMAVLLSEYAAGSGIDTLRVLKMVLIHDIVEIDAGDTFLYDRAELPEHKDAERRAADRLFGILPDDQAEEFRALWDEFEARETPEARFGASLDRLQPMLSNYYTRGGAWNEHGVRIDMVEQQNRHMGEGAPDLWEYARELLTDAIEKGYLKEQAP